MSDEESYPVPRLTVLAPALAGAPLPVRVTVANPGPAPLAGGRCELTLEVERGVLLTWLIPVGAVPPGAEVEALCERAEPDYRLPLGVPAGEGRLAILLTGPDGGWLNEATATLMVAEEGAAPRGS